MIEAKIKYDGDYKELEDLGVILFIFRPEFFDLSATIPLDQLPAVCQLQGVKLIYPTIPGDIDFVH